MARFVKTTDFETGEFLISQQDQTTNLEAVIDRIEEEVLQDLLGKELYDLFIADLVAGPIPQIPAAARFTDIYDKFFESDPNYFRSEGMIKMLQMFIWFEFIKDSGMQNTPVGIVTNAFENSTALSANQAGIEKTYNRGLRTYNAIAGKIVLDRTTYPEFDGVFREAISFL